MWIFILNSTNIRNAIFFLNILFIYLFIFYTVLILCVYVCVYIYIYIYIYIYTCVFIIIFTYDDKAEFTACYSSFQYHMILQKSY